ncbi:MAG: glycosyltransferase family 2 protein [Acidobacteria bacterium]|nr:glycosyltransferase family 2 protein [Acidobacteriota bacterium]
MRLSVVIPCFNEEANVRALGARLGPVLRGLTTRFDGIEVVLVDDGSRDGTWAAMEVFAAAGHGLDVTLRRHDVNRGLGQAMRTGLSAASGDVMVTTDSDATYRFEEIPGLLDTLGPGVDLVTASPYHPRGAVDNVPAFRLLFSRGASLMYRLLVRRDIYTWTALFRAYRRDVIRTVPFAASGFLAGTELLVNAIDAGFRAAEFPTVLHARVLGVSKARIARTVRAHLGFQGQLLWRRLSGATAAGTPALPPAAAP